MIDSKDGIHPYGWKIQGVSRLVIGEYAEVDAKAEAKRIGGTCEAFPLYTAPLPASEWVGLSPEDYTTIQARIPDTDTVCEFVFADIVAAVEATLKGKNT
jgi:hypothetical protein